MNKKNASLPNSRRRASSLTSNKIKTEDIQEFVYHGNDCVTRYWVYNDELGCIAGGHIANQYDDLAEELQAKAIVERLKQPS